VLRDYAAKNTNMSSDNVSVTCNAVTCHAIVSATVDNLTNVIPNPIDGVGQVVYTPIKFTVEFNGGVVCPITPTPESCFVFNPDTNTITDYNYTTEGCPSDVTIPSTIGGVAVTTIGTSAFENNNLTCITFPSSVTTIGGSAFRNNNITSLIIPSSVTSVGGFAFSGNVFTKGVIWNANISSVGNAVYGPFEKSYVEFITFGQNVTKIPSKLFQSANLGFTHYVVPNNITIIGSSAFSNTILANVTFHNNVNAIGDSAFRNLNLTSLTIPSSVTSVGGFAFSDNEFTDGVVWNANISSSGNAAFGPFEKTYVKSITFGPNVTKIPSKMFKSATLGTTDYSVPNHIASIGSDAFASSGLIGLTIPESVTSVGGFAFSGNVFTKGVIWNANISSVGNAVYGPFENSYVEFITFGQNVSIISGKLLKSANLNFNNYIVPTNITTIGSGAFANTKLVDITFHNSVAIIGGNAFSDNQLISVFIPNSVTSIGSYAFSGNATLTSVTIDNVAGAVSIGYNAFGGIEPVYSQ